MRAAKQSPRIEPRGRGALLMPICVLAVHQVRFYVAFGSRAPGQLARDGHAYLSTVEPFALLCLALAVGALLGRLAAVRQRPTPSTPVRLARVWSICALTLFALYCAQELFEGLFATGHPAGIAGVLGHGGWIAVPAAITIGGALALTLRVAEVLIALVARIGGRGRRRAGAMPARRAALVRSDWRLVPLSGGTASRAPPRALSLS